MFSGIVAALGTIEAVVRSRGALGLTVACGFATRGIDLGESVAVDGVCLTVARRGRRRLGFDVVRETVARTTLGTAEPGRRVNLERSLRAGEPIGGHLVAGHVDAVVPVLRVTRRGGDRRLRVGLPARLQPLVALKGSIALQGVSLTVSAVERGACEVALVPYTLAHTTLGGVAAGDRLNVEVDLVARYLDRILRSRHGRR